MARLAAAVAAMACIAAAAGQECANGDLEGGRCARTESRADDAEEHAALQLPKPGASRHLLQMLGRDPEESLAGVEVTPKLIAQVKLKTYNKTIPLAVRDGTFAKDVWTEVKLGLPAVCIDGSEYSFQVLPGDTDKLLIYFQGGGACWNYMTTEVEPQCTTHVSYQDYTGVFDRGNSSNPYRHYTVLFVNYCSGDAFIGNKTQEYTAKGSQSKAKQMGYWNAMGAVQWMLNEGKAKGLICTTSLDTLSLMGCSAGTLGMQAWAGYLFNAFPAAVQEGVYDSYLGIFPPGTQGEILKNTWAACHLAILDAAMTDLCVQGQLTIQFMVKDTFTLPRDSTVNWVYVNAKTDVEQMIFYRGICLFGPGRIVDLIGFDDTKYYELANAMLNDYQLAPKNHVNFAAYLINGQYHCYTCNSVWADNPESGGPLWAGPRGHVADMGTPQLNTWLRDTVVPGQNPTSVCDGEYIPPGEPVPKHTNNTYCRFGN